MNSKVKKIVYTALFAALICVATFIIKFPSSVTHGYIHIGDGFIFLAVMLLGKKYGSLAGGIGAALSDTLGGYGQYIIPTFIIKFIMGFIIGSIIEKKADSKKTLIIAMVLGSLWQIVGYYFVGSIFIGSFVASIADIPGNILQSLVGVIIAILVGPQLKKYIKFEK